MEEEKYFGGAEGGATHSNLVICDSSGQVIGRAKGPGTNHWAFGMEECVNRIEKMVLAAKEEAGIPVDRPLDSLGLSLSGCEQDSSNAVLAELVREREGCAKEVHVASDTAGSLFTGAPDGGIVLIAGTGSNAHMRTSDGKQYNCGGWGHLLGDEGGAYWIAYNAVKAVLDDADGFNPCPYQVDRVWETIRDHFKVETRTDLIPHAYKDFEKPKFAGLTVKLSELATNGDALSKSLFQSAGVALARHLVALLRRADVGSARVVCVGSVWRSWPLLASGMIKELYKNDIKTKLEFVRLRVSSAMGAAWLAARHVNFDLPRDDRAFCEVFYTYEPETTIGVKGDNVTKSNGCNGITNGHGDVCNGFELSLDD